MNQNIENITVHYLWEEKGYHCGPEVTFCPELTKNGVRMQITVHESNRKRVMAEHFQPVHLDSCVEWFVNFSPETSDRYFNFEGNANGVMNVAYRKDRHEFQTMTVEDVESLHIRTKIEEMVWTVEYEVPFELMEKYVPGFVRADEMTIKANFYKCGDETEFPHFGVWKKVETPEPDFHRPEYFGEVVLKRSH